MRILISIAIFYLICQTSAPAAEPPSHTYDELGFKTVNVIDFKKSLREEGEEVPRFPPRTSNALIVESVDYDSRSANAGLEDQDLITIINDKLLKSPDEGNQILKKITYKDDLKLRIIRRNENKWERINVQIKPLSDLEYYRTQVFDRLRRDDDFSVCRIWKSPRASSRFSNRNGTIQLYFKKKRGEPLQLLFQMSMFVTDAPIWKDQSKLPGFIIKTDLAEYRLAVGDKEMKKELEFQKQLEEAEKSVQLAQERMEAVAKKKDRDSAEYSKAVRALQAAKLKNVRLQIAEREQVLRVRREIKRDSQETLANFAEVYANTSERIRKMLDELGEKLSMLENVSEETLLMLELKGLARSQVGLARMLEGWVYYEMPLKKDQRKMIEDIISSKTVIMYHESKPDKKYEVTPEQKEQMKAVLAVFEAEGGKVGE